MTAGLIVWLILTLVALAIASDSTRRELEQAQKRHPANYQDELDDHWAGVVELFDDGKALVRETEDYLRRRA